MKNECSCRWRAAAGALAAAWLVQRVAFANDGRIEICQPMMPYVITNSGSYVVTESLSVPATNVDAITVAADNVTIDLNGQVLQGPGLSATGRGIYQPAGRVNLVVLNGTVAGWDDSAGIQAEGAGVRVENVSARDNSMGIYVRKGGVIRRCTAAGRAGTTWWDSGIRVDDCGVIRESVAFDNAVGIMAAAGVVISDCTAYSNHVGILLDGPGNIVLRSSACNNYYDGIDTQLGVVEGCAALGSGYNNGIALHDSALISACSARANRRIGIGFHEDDFGLPQTYPHGSLILDCAVSQNGRGIAVLRDSLIAGCVAADNTNQGIRVLYNGSFLRDNLCRNNGVGIHVESPWLSESHHVRIEGNAVMDNGTGIQVDEAFNLTVKNVASGNDTNYFAVDTNYLGAIVSTPLNNWPWSNFEY